MAIVYSTGFTGIALDQALEAFDPNWVLHPTTTYGYAGSTEHGGALYAKGASQVCMVQAQGAGTFADCHVTARFVHSSGGTSVSSSAVIARSDPTVRSHYGARIASGNFELFKRTSGANATLASVASGKSLPYDFVLGVKCVGNQIYLTVDGVDTLGPITDNSFASGYGGLYATGVPASTNAILMDDFSIDDLVPGSSDTTAPTLTSATASATGSTTASGSVSTNEANGTLYYLASANATELAATVKAGSSQAVTATLEQPVTVTGLTASTSYYLHFVHRDASGNDSDVATSAQFTTEAPSGDAEPPTLTGSVTFASITQTTYTAQWPAGSDNVGVTGYEYQIGSTAGAWTDAGNNLSAAITGRTAGTTETVYVRAYDAAGLRSTPAISGSVTLESALAAGINVTEPLKNNTGTLLASLSGVRVAVLQAADLVSVYETSGLTTNGAGILATISDAAITAGQQYHIAIKLADGGIGITGPITAS